jgi:hypothetical protein
MEGSRPVKISSEFVNELALLESAADLAQDILDKDAASDQSILFAIKIVEGFLRRRGRICYGGQAINAHLPNGMKFYDAKKNIPDYDFLTPDADADIKEIVADFRQEGYKNISVRMGMHEGTTKVYVDYIPVADVTAVNPDLYGILHKRSEKIGGINYIDVNTLRMMMYLELSRPRGEVKRWSKVYERLSLLNAAKPIHNGRCADEMGLGTPHGKYSIGSDVFETIVDFIIHNRRVLIGASVIDYYKKQLSHTRKTIKHWLFSNKKPLIFYSPNMKADLDEIANRIDKKVHIEYIDSVGEFIPKVGLLYIGGTAKEGPRRLVAAAIQESACHSYNTVGLYYKNEEQIMRIGSLDTLATLYLSLGLLPVIEKKLHAPLLCMAQTIVELGIRNRKRHGSKRIPFISLRCEGHQPRMQSLLREKVERIRAAAASNMKKTRKSSKSKRSTTRRH